MKGLERYEKSVQKLINKKSRLCYRQTDSEQNFGKCVQNMHGGIRAVSDICPKLTTKSSLLCLCY